MKCRGSFLKGNPTAQSHKLAGSACSWVASKPLRRLQQEQPWAYERLSLCSQTARCNPTRWSVVLRPGQLRCSRAVVCEYSPGGWTLPSLHTHSWTPAARSRSGGKWVKWAWATSAGLKPACNSFIFFRAEKGNMGASHNHSWVAHSSV